MKIHVTDTDKIDEIRFQHKNGIGIAGWTGELPEINKDYYVELDIDKDLIFDTDVVLTQSKITGIYVCGNDCLIVGILEHIYEDDVCVIRLGDSIFMCTIFGAKGHKGKFVRIKTDSLRLTSYEL